MPDLLIPLTKGQSTVIDVEDWDLVRAWRWSAAYNISSGKYYARRTVREHPKKYQIHMHRWLLNIPKGMVCDHINGDSLDNRRKNLRIVTVAQNSANLQNVKGYSISTSGKYNARICINYKLIHLGGFDTEEEAKQAYLKASREMRPWLYEGSV